MLLLALSPATLLALLRLLASVLSVLCPVRPCLSPCVFYVLLHLFTFCTFMLLPLSPAFSPSTLFALLRLLHKYYQYCALETLSLPLCVLCTSTPFHFLHFSAAGFIPCIFPFHTFCTFTPFRISVISIVSWRPCLSPCVFYVLLHLFTSCTSILLALCPP